MAGAYGNVRMVTGIKADIGALAGLCHGAGQVIPGFPAVKNLPSWHTSVLGHCEFWPQPAGLTAERAPPKAVIAFPDLAGYTGRRVPAFHSAQSIPGWT